VLKFLPVKKSETGFLILALLAGLGSCGAGSRNSVSFYLGMKAETPEDAAACFERALGSPNVFIRDAAALELIPAVLSGIFPAGQALRKSSARNGMPIGVLRAAALYALGSFGEAAGYRTYPVSETVPGAAGWIRVLSLLAELRIREGTGETPADFPDLKNEAFALLSGAAASFHEEAALAWMEEERHFLSFALFDETEEAALAGHTAVMRSGFVQGLESFRTVIEADKALFFRYPQLLQDLGRCFQFSSPAEGLRLFTGWDTAGEIGDLPGIRYRLLFFAARMARQQSSGERGTELFRQALAFAPDAAQKDACIWYILELALSSGEDPAGAFNEWIPHCEDLSYFSDLLDRLAAVLTAEGRWRDIAGIYGLIRGRPGRVSAAQYAWILGRAAVEGLAEPADIDQTVPADFAVSCFRAAYERGYGSLYYRLVSAAALNEPFLIPESEKNAGRASNSALVQFFLGFFKNRAPGYQPYLQAFLAGPAVLPAEELRSLARAMGEEGFHADAIRLVSSYMGRDGYTLVREDLEITFPRPYRRQIEERAAGAGIAPEILFGLIRTESAFQPGIVSRAGAAGLTQLMPETAAETSGRLKRLGGPDYKADPDLLNPDINIHLGAAYLGYLMDRLENPLLALLAYNGGINRVRRWRAASALADDLFLETVEFTETREYGRRVLSAAAVYRYLYY
jgi:soluble lytic murein transglycosylase